MIDLKAFKECYEKLEINDEAFISSKHNVADALTKVKGNPFEKKHCITHSCLMRCKSDS